MNWKNFSEEKPIKNGIYLIYWNLHNEWEKVYYFNGKFYYYTFDSDFEDINSNHDPDYWAEVDLPVCRERIPPKPKGPENLYVKHGRIVNV